MKRLFIISFALSLVLSSCVQYPDASFTVNYTQVQPGETVQFSNFSDDAVSYIWDFGDGFTSTLPNPEYSWTTEGDYTVSLTAVSGDGKSDITSITISVWYTILEITAAEWNEDEIVQFIIPDALIVLYENGNDWYNDANSIGYGYTDDYGEVAFYPMDPIRYWVWVEADDVAEEGDHYDNYDFYGYNNNEYLYTPVLVPWAINTWIAWADYFPVVKSMKSRREKYDIEKIKSTGKSFILLDVSE
jgi:PKD repeat protein